MEVIKKFSSVAELQKLQRMACSVKEPVFIRSMDDAVEVDAKSFINLFTLDFTHPVKVVSDSEKLCRFVEEMEEPSLLG